MMIDPKDFYDLLVSKGIDFFTGVPDSSLKSFCAYVNDNVGPENHIIAANEGNAVALAAGYHLATGKIGLVYLQNSGQGNAVNPLTSLVDKDVYSIPLFLVIGWRGEPGKKDEPQHIKQGKITLDLLKTLEIPYSILPDSLDEVKKVLDVAFNSMNENDMPYALVVRKNSFEPYVLGTNLQNSYDLTREGAIKIFVDNIGLEDIVVSTTGKTSRELFEYRERLKQGHGKDFLTVGSMGHSSSIALGIALSKPDRQVYCLDGDGSLMMHMGVLSVIASQNPKNFKHIILNNGCHDSVGGQPTTGFNIDIPAIAKASGYKVCLKAETKEEFLDKFKLLKTSEGPSLLEVRLKRGSRENLGRPTKSPLDNKKDFMKFLGKI